MFLKFSLNHSALDCESRFFEHTDEIGQLDHVDNVVVDGRPKNEESTERKNIRDLVESTLSNILQASQVSGNSEHTGSLNSEHNISIGKFIAELEGLFHRASIKKIYLNP